MVAIYEDRMSHYIEECDLPKIHVQQRMCCIVTPAVFFNCVEILRTVLLKILNINYWEEYYIQNFYLC